MEQSEIQQAMADKLAEVLGEDQDKARTILRRVVDELGGPACVELLRRTLEVESQGGMMTADGSRRRTRGGVFFFLAKQSMTKHQRIICFPQPWQRQWRKKLLRRREREAIQPQALPLGD